MYQTFDRADPSGYSTTTSPTYTSTYSGTTFTEYANPIERFRTFRMSDPDLDGIVYQAPAPSFQTSSTFVYGDLSTVTDPAIAARMLTLGITNDGIIATVDKSLGWNAEYNDERQALRLAVQAGYYKQAISILRTTPLAITYWCGAVTGNPTPYLWAFELPLPVACGTATGAPTLTLYSHLVCTNLASESPLNGCMEPYCGAANCADPNTEQWERRIKTVTATTKADVNAYVGSERYAFGVGWGDHILGSVILSADSMKVTWKLNRLVAPNPVVSAKWEMTRATNNYYVPRHALLYTWGGDFGDSRTIALSPIRTRASTSATFTPWVYDSPDPYAAPWQSRDWSIQYKPGELSHNHEVDAKLDLLDGHRAVFAATNVTADLTTPSNEGFVFRYHREAQPIGGTKHRLILGSPAECAACPALHGEVKMTIFAPTTTFATLAFVGFPKENHITYDLGTDGDGIASFDLTTNMSETAGGHYRDVQVTLDGPDLPYMSGSNDVIRVTYAGDANGANANPYLLHGATYVFDRVNAWSNTTSLGDPTKPKYRDNLTLKPNSQVHYKFHTRTSDCDNDACSGMLGMGGLSNTISIGDHNARFWAAPTWKIDPRECGLPYSLDADGIPNDCP